jgi:hypothetical protein
VKVNSTLLVPFGMANMESSNYINGSVVGVNKQGRVIKRLGHLFQPEIEIIRYVIEDSFKVPARTCIDLYHHYNDR